MKSYGVTIQMKAPKQYFPVILFVVLIFESVDKISLGPSILHTQNTLPFCLLNANSSTFQIESVKLERYLALWGRSVPEMPGRLECYQDYRRRCDS